MLSITDIKILELQIFQINLRQNLRAAVGWWDWRMTFVNKIGYFPSKSCVADDALV